MGYMGKGVLMILAGLALILGSLGYLYYDPWLIVGLLLLLAGLVPFFCKDKYCAPGKKKR